MAKFSAGDVVVLKDRSYGYVVATDGQLIESRNYLLDPDTPGTRIELTVVAVDCVLPTRENNRGRVNDVILIDESGYVIFSCSEYLVKSDEVPDKDLMVDEIVNHIRNNPNALIIDGSNVTGGFDNREDDFVIVNLDIAWPNGNNVLLYCDADGSYIITHTDYLKRSNY